MGPKSSLGRRKGGSGKGCVKAGTGGPANGVCRMARCVVPRTTAVWAPNQVWGDGIWRWGDGRGRWRGGRNARGQGAEVLPTAVVGQLGALCRQRPPYGPQIKFGATEFGVEGDGKGALARREDCVGAGGGGLANGVRRTARCAVPRTTAVWAPNQVWGDGILGTGAGRRGGLCGSDAAGVGEQQKSDGGEHDQEDGDKLADLVAPRGGFFARSVAVLAGSGADGGERLRFSERSVGR